MTKKRLLILTSTFPRWENDSTPPFVWELSKKLQTKFDVIILAPHYPGSKENDIWNGIKIKRFRYFFSSFEKLAVGDGIISTLKKNPLYYLLIPFFIIGEFFALKRSIKKFQPDLVHAHWIIPQGLLMSLTGYKKPFLITTHGGDIWAFRNPLMTKIKKLALKRSTAITVVSKAIKNEIEKNIIQDKKINVISMGVDTNTFAPNRRSDSLRQKYQNKKIILFVGRLVEKKGIEYLVKAMPEIINKNSKLQLLIIGAGPLENKLQKLITELKLENNISMLGAKPNSDLPTYYASSDIFVAPSIEANSGDKEGLPVTLMEAMSSATVVVSSDLEGNKDLIIDGQNGFLCKQKNPSSISDVIKKILDNNELVEIKNNARKTIVNNFSWEVVGHKYEKILNEL